MKRQPGQALKGHVFQCHSCGLTRDYIGAMVNHIRGAHHRRVSAPEYLSVTERQARDFRHSPALEVAIRQRAYDER